MGPGNPHPTTPGRGPAAPSRPVRLSERSIHLFSHLLLMKYVRFLTALTASALLSSCHLVGGGGSGDHDGGCPGPLPAPACVGGTIVGFTCMDGPLIDVDATHRIGVPAVLHNGQRTGNLIIVANRDGLGRVDSVGQRVYFTPVNDPSYQWSGMACLAADAIGQSVPRLVLRNVSATGCPGQLRK